MSLLRKELASDVSDSGRADSSALQTIDGPEHSLSFYAELLSALRQQGANDELEQQAKVGLRTHVDHPMLLQALVEAAIGRREHRLAAQRVARLLALHPGHPPALAARVNIQIAQGDGEAARHAAAAALAIAPGYFPNRLAAVRVEIAARNWRRAIERADEAIEAWPDQPLPFELKAQALEQTDRPGWREAQQLNQTNVKRWPARKSGYLGQIRLSRKLDDLTAESAAVCAALRAFPDCFVVSARFGEWLQRSGRLRAARRFAERAVQRWPAADPIHLLLASVLTQQGYLTAAAAALRRAMDRLPNCMPLQVRLADVLGKLGRAPEATASLRRLLQTDRDQPGALLTLIRLKQRQGFDQLAHELIDEGRRRFPDNHYFLLCQIQLLRSREAFADCRAEIEAAIRRFPDLLAFELESARLWTAAFRFERARQVYQEIVRNHPVLLSAKLGLIEAEIELGLQRQARKRLVELTKDPKFSPPAQFFRLCHRALSADNQADDWPLLGARLLRLSVLDPQFSLKYLSSLEAGGAPEAAAAFLDCALREATPQTVKTHLLLEHERARIRSRQILLSGEPDQRLAKCIEACTEKAHQRVVSRIGQSAEHDAAHAWVQRHGGQLDRITKLSCTASLDSYSNPLAALEVAQAIVDRIRRRQPFSLIRLGDGEGNFLPYEASWQQWQAADQATIQRVWWGRPELNQGQVMFEILDRSMASADIVGLADRRRLLAMVDVFADAVQTPLLRHTRGISAVNNFIERRIQSQPDWQAKRLASNFIHHDLDNWGLYDYILSHVTHCCLITCHTDLPSVVQRRFGVAVRRTHLVPNEYRWRHLFGEQSAVSHYQERYPQLLKEIEVACPGELYLVGAGALGKGYCDEIKRQGGIAIDIGSRVDYWLGYQTRDVVLKPEDNDSLACYQKVLTTTRQPCQLRPVVATTSAPALRHYWINLDQEVQRRDATNRLLDSWGVAHQRVTATTPTDLGVARVGDSLTTDAELACVVSHLHAIRRGLEDGHACFVVQEDDLTGPDQIDLAALINTAPADWEVLQLHTANPRRINDLYSSGRYGRLWAPWQKTNFSAAMYVISQRAASKLLQMYPPDAAGFDLGHAPGRCVADRIIYSSCTTYTLTRPIVRCADHTSSIHAAHLPLHRAGSNAIKKVQLLCHANNPTVQYGGHRKTSSPTPQLVVGLGTGRSGTTSLARLLSIQRRTLVTHEMNANPAVLPNWFGDTKTALANVNYIADRYRTEVAGDVGSSYLPYVESIAQAYPGCRFVCMLREPAATVDSFLRWTEGRNHWQVNSDANPDPQWDDKFPTFSDHLTKRAAVERYVEQYHRRAEQLVRDFAGRFRIVRVEDLNDESEALALLRWLGYRTRRFEIFGANRAA